MAACANAEADADADWEGEWLGADGGGEEEAPLRARASALRHLVARDPLAADAALTLFASAVFSHRYASVARPLPKGCQSIHRLTAALDAAPALRSLLGGGRAAQMAPPATLALLLWLLTPPAHRKHAPRAVLRALPRSHEHHPPPSYLFEVENPTLDAKWRALAQGKRTLLVFLGQPLDAFHSVVNLGLRSLGDQVVLRRSLARALQDSSPGYGLGSSELGARLQCVAEVQVALSPGGVALSLPPSEQEQDDQRDVVVRDGRLGRVARLLLFKAVPPLQPPSPTPATAPAVRATPLRGFGDANANRLPEFRFEVETDPQLTCKEGIDFWTSFPAAPPKKDLPCSPSCECANKPVMRKARSFPFDKTRNHKKELSPELEKRLQSMALDKYEDFDEDWESFLRSLNEADGSAAADSSEAAPPTPSPPPPPPATPPRSPNAPANQTPPTHNSPDASHRFSPMSSTANTTEDLFADDTLSSTRTQDSTESSRRDAPSLEADSASGAQDQADDLPPMPYHGLIRRPPPLKLEPRKPRWDHLPITQYSPSRYQVRTDYSTDTDESLPLSEEQPGSEGPVTTPEDTPAQATEPQASTSAEPVTSDTGSKRMPKCKTVPSKRKSSKEASGEDDKGTAEASKRKAKAPSPQGSRRGSASHAPPPAPAPPPPPPPPATRSPAPAPPPPHSDRAPAPPHGEAVAPAEVRVYEETSATHLAEIPTRTPTGRRGAPGAGETKASRIPRPALQPRRLSFDQEPQEQPEAAPTPAADTSQSPSSWPHDLSEGGRAEVAREAAKMHDMLHNRQSSSDFSSFGSFDTQKKIFQEVSFTYSPDSLSLQSESDTEAQIWEEIMKSDHGPLAAEDAEEENRSVRSAASVESEDLRREFEETLIEPIFQSQVRTDGRGRRLLVLLLHTSHSGHQQPEGF